MQYKPNESNLRNTAQPYLRGQSPMKSLFKKSVASETSIRGKDLEVSEGQKSERFRASAPEPHVFYSLACICTLTIVGTFKNSCGPRKLDDTMNLTKSSKFFTKLARAPTSN